MASRRFAFGACRCARVSRSDPTLQRTGGHEVGFVTWRLSRPPAAGLCVNPNHLRPTSTTYAPHSSLPAAPFGAEWEIRFGPDNRFRVLYDIDEEEHSVQVIAIGEKAGSRLIVGGEEVEL